MSSRISPSIFRSGYFNLTWKSQWYSGSNYTLLLFEDNIIKQYLNNYHYYLKLPSINYNYKRFQHSFSYVYNLVYFPYFNDFSDLLLFNFQFYRLNIYKIENIDLYQHYAINSFVNLFTLFSLNKQPVAKLQQNMINLFYLYKLQTKYTNLIFIKNIYKINNSEFMRIVKDNKLLLIRIKYIFNLLNNKLYNLLLINLKKEKYSFFIKQKIRSSYTLKRITSIESIKNIGLSNRKKNKFKKKNFNNLVNLQNGFSNYFKSNILYNFNKYNSDFFFSFFKKNTIDLIKIYFNFFFNRKINRYLLRKKKGKMPIKKISLKLKRLSKRKFFRKKIKYHFFFKKFKAYSSSLSKIKNNIFFFLTELKSLIKSIFFFFNFISYFNLLNNKKVVNLFNLYNLNLYFLSSSKLFSLFLIKNKIIISKLNNSIQLKYYFDKKIKSLYYFFIMKYNYYGIKKIKKKKKEKHLFFKKKNSSFLFHLPIYLYSNEYFSFILYKINKAMDYLKKVNHFYSFCNNYNNIIINYSKKNNIFNNTFFFLPRFITSNLFLNRQYKYNLHVKKRLFAKKRKKIILHEKLNEINKAQKGSTFYFNRQTIRNNLFHLKKLRKDKLHKYKLKFENSNIKLIRLFRNKLKTKIASNSYTINLEQFKKKNIKYYKFIKNYNLFLLIKKSIFLYKKYTNKIKNLLFKILNLRTRYLSLIKKNTNFYTYSKIKNNYIKLYNLNISLYQYYMKNLKRISSILTTEYKYLKTKSLFKKIKFFNFRYKKKFRLLKLKLIKGRFFKIMKKLFKFKHFSSFFNFKYKLRFFSKYQISKLHSVITKMVSKSYKKRKLFYLFFKYNNIFFKKLNKQHTTLYDKNKDIIFTLFNLNLKYVLFNKLGYIISFFLEKKVFQNKQKKLNIIHIFFLKKLIRLFNQATIYSNYYEYFLKTYCVSISEVKNQNLIGLKKKIIFFFHSKVVQKLKLSKYKKYNFKFKKSQFDFINKKVNMLNRSLLLIELKSFKRLKLNNIKKALNSLITSILKNDTNKRKSCNLFNIFNSIFFLKKKIRSRRRQQIFYLKRENKFSIYNVKNNIKLKFLFLFLNLSSHKFNFILNLNKKNEFLSFILKLKKNRNFSVYQHQNYNKYLIYLNLVLLFDNLYIYFNYFKNMMLFPNSILQKKLHFFNNNRLNYIDFIKFNLIRNLKSKINSFFLSIFSYNKLNLLFYKLIYLKKLVNIKYKSVTNRINLKNKFFFFRKKKNKISINPFFKLNILYLFNLKNKKFLFKRKENKIVKILILNKNNFNLKLFLSKISLYGALQLKLNRLYLSKYYLSNHKISILINLILNKNNKLYQQNFKTSKIQVNKKNTLDFNNLNKCHPLWKKKINFLFFFSIYKESLFFFLNKISSLKKKYFILFFFILNSINHNFQFKLNYLTVNYHKIKGLILLLCKNNNLKLNLNYYFLHNILYFYKLKGILVIIRYISDYLASFYLYYNNLNNIILFNTLYYKYNMSNNKIKLIKQIIISNKIKKYNKKRVHLNLSSLKKIAANKMLKKLQALKFKLNKKYSKERFIKPKLNNQSLEQEKKRTIFNYKKRIVASQKILYNTLKIIEKAKNSKRKNSKNLNLAKKQPAPIPMYDLLESLGFKKKEIINSGNAKNGAFLKKLSDKYQQNKDINVEKAFFYLKLKKKKINKLLKMKLKKFKQNKFRFFINNFLYKSFFSFRTANIIKQTIFLYHLFNFKMLRLNEILYIYNIFKLNINLNFLNFKFKKNTFNYLQTKKRVLIFSLVSKYILNRKILKSSLSSFYKKKQPDSFSFNNYKKKDNSNTKHNFNNKNSYFNKNNSFPFNNYKKRDNLNTKSNFISQNSNFYKNNKKNPFILKNRNISNIKNKKYINSSINFESIKLSLLNLLTKRIEMDKNLSFFNRTKHNNFLNREKLLLHCIKFFFFFKRKKRLKTHMKLINLYYYNLFKINYKKKKQFKSNLYNLLSALSTFKLNKKKLTTKKEIDFKFNYLLKKRNLNSLFLLMFHKYYNKSLNSIFKPRFENKTNSIIKSINKFKRSMQIRKYNYKTKSINFQNNYKLKSSFYKLMKQRTYFEFNKIKTLKLKYNNNIYKIKQNVPISCSILKSNIYNIIYNKIKLEFKNIQNLAINTPKAFFFNLNFKLKHYQQQFQILLFFQNLKKIIKSIKNKKKLLLKLILFYILKIKIKLMSLKKKIYYLLAKILLLDFKKKKKNFKLNKKINLFVRTKMFFYKKKKYLRYLKFNFKKKLRRTKRFKINTRKMNSLFYKKNKEDMNSLKHKSFKFKKYNILKKYEKMKLNKKARRLIKHGKLLTIDNKINFADLFKQRKKYNYFFFFRNRKKNNKFNLKKHKYNTNRLFRSVYLKYKNQVGPVFKLLKLLKFRKKVKGLYLKPLVSLKNNYTYYNINSVYKGKSALNKNKMDSIKRSSFFLFLKLNAFKKAVLLMKLRRKKLYNFYYYFISNIILKKKKKFKTKLFLYKKRLSKRRQYNTIFRKYYYYSYSKPYYKQRRNKYKKHYQNSYKKTYNPQYNSSFRKPYHKQQRTSYNLMDNILNLNRFKEKSLKAKSYRPKRKKTKYFITFFKIAKKSLKSNFLNLRSLIKYKINYNNYNNFIKLKAQSFYLNYSNWLKLINYVNKKNKYSIFDKKSMLFKSGIINFDSLLNYIQFFVKSFIMFIFRTSKLNFKNKMKLILYLKCIYFNSIKFFRFKLIKLNLKNQLFTFSYKFNQLIDFIYKCNKIKNQFYSIINNTIDFNSDENKNYYKGSINKIMNYSLFYLYLKRKIVFSSNLNNFSKLASFYTKKLYLYKMKYNLAIKKKKKRNYHVIPSLVSKNIYYNNKYKFIKLNNKYNKNYIYYLISNLNYIYLKRKKIITNFLSLDNISGYILKLKNVLKLKKINAPKLNNYYLFLKNKIASKLKFNYYFNHFMYQSKLYYLKIKTNYKYQFIYNKIFSQLFKTVNKITKIINLFFNSNKIEMLKIKRNKLISFYLYLKNIKSEKLKYNTINKFFFIINRLISTHKIKKKKSIFFNKKMNKILNSRNNVISIIYNNNLFIFNFKLVQFLFLFNQLQNHINSIINNLFNKFSLISIFKKEEKQFIGYYYYYYFYYIYFYTITLACLIFNYVKYFLRTLYKNNISFEMNNILYKNKLFIFLKLIWQFYYSSLANIKIKHYKIVKFIESNDSIDLGLILKRNMKWLNNRKLSFIQLNYSIEYDLNQFSLSSTNNIFYFNNVYFYNYDYNFIFTLESKLLCDYIVYAFLSKKQYFEINDEIKESINDLYRFKIIIKKHYDYLLFKLLNYYIDFIIDFYYFTEGTIHRIDLNSLIILFYKKLKAIIQLLKSVFILVLIMNNFNIKGIRIKYSGRKSRKVRADTKFFSRHKMSLNCLLNRIDYYYKPVRIKYGAVGIKVFIYKENEYITPLYHLLFKGIINRANTITKLINIKGK